MPKTQKNTGERLLRSGLDLLSQEGLSGVTLGRLAEPVVLEPAMRAPAGLARLRVVIERWFGWAPRAGLPGGCPIAAAMFELDDIESPARDKVLQMEAAWRATLGQFVAEAQRSGELRADLDVEQFVWELCGIYLSHHVASRFVRDTSADRRASVAVESLLTRAQASS